MILQNQRLDLSRAITRLLIGAFSASTIPTGFSLILCAFYGLNLMENLQGVEIYIAFAGISLISIAALAAYEEKKRLEEKPSDGES